MTTRETAIVAVAVALIAVAGCGGGSAASSSGSPSSSIAITTASTTESDTSSARVTSSRQSPALSNQQQLALQAAKDYLDTQAFSRLGLIHQLSSRDGDGYNEADATVAVDSLKEDWNAQAVKEAADYLGTQPFSCSGLIEQLNSPDGSQFTKAQAIYGAHHSKACS